METKVKKVDFLSLELTNYCNFDCTFCTTQFITRKKGFMDTELAKRLIREAKENEFCDYVVTNVMGEPFLHKGLFEIVDYAKSINQSVVVITNGELLTRKSAIKLYEANVTDIGISYHGNDEESWSCRKAKIGFKDYEKQIFDVIEAKYQTQAKTTLNVQLISTADTPHDQFKILKSKEDIERFSEKWLSFARSLKKKYGLKWIIPHKLYSGANGLLPGLSVTIYSKYHTWSNEIVPGDTKVEAAEKCHCRVPFHQCDVHWNGDMTLCCIDYDGDLVYDNVLGKGLVETYNSAKAQEVRGKFIEGTDVPAKCLKCVGVVVNENRTLWMKDKSILDPTAGTDALARKFYRGYSLMKNKELGAVLKRKVRENFEKPITDYLFNLKKSA